MPRILVADDNSNIQKMVALALEEQGIDVVSVGNGEAAVRRIPDLAPDLVLADVFMPVRNGYEVCEFVKKDQRFSHVPVILLVGAFDPLDEKEARRVGADGVLKKPFVPPDPLIAMVTSALEKNPKIAAEIAKEREAALPKAEPPLPPIALEAPARTAPKPLPEFPEPLPEEAGLVYGFDKKPAPSEEDASPRFARKPEETEEEFDDSVTASDWRRNAANFDVPEELGSKPAFATDEDFGPVVFPSERDVPPKHYPVISDDVVGREDASPRASSPARTSEPSPSAPSLPSVPSVLDDSFFQQTASVPEPQPAAASAPPTQHAPGGTAHAPSDYSEESWMSSIFGKFRRPKTSKEDQEEPAASAEASAQNYEASFEPAARLSTPAHVQDTPSAESHPAPSQKPPNEREPQEDQAGEEQIVRREEPSKRDSWFAPPPSVLRDSREASESSRQAARPASPSSGFPWTDVTSMSSEFENHGSDALSPRASAKSGEPSPELHATPVEPAIPALHAFLPSGPVETPADQDSAADPAVHDVPAAPIFAPASLESLADTGSHFGSDSGDRLPTAPPPNREALANIPFLAPPPPAPFADARDESKSTQHASGARESATPDSSPFHASGEPRGYQGPDETTNYGGAEQGLIHAAVPAAPEGYVGTRSSESQSGAPASANERQNDLGVRSSVTESAVLASADATSSPSAPSATESVAAPSVAGSATPSVPGSAAPSVDAVVSRLLEKLEPRLHQLLAKDLLKPLVEDLLSQELANKK